MQPEKPCSVGRADGDAKDAAADSDPVGDGAPEASGIEAESAFQCETRVVGRPLENGLCGGGFGDGQCGP